MNIFRDLRWGRGHETPGEDPSLNAVYGSMFIAGFQGDSHMPANGTSRPPLHRLRSSACAKHFFACACTLQPRFPCTTPTDTISRHT